MIECPSGCVDGTRDGHNCGSCGHDCLGGGCISSACTPALVASGQTLASVLTVSDAGVFWANENGQLDGSTIRGCPLAGCDAGATTLAAGQNTQIALVADDTTVYWGSGDSQGQPGISSCSATGCASPTTIFQSSNALSIGVDQANVYWTDGSTLWSCPKTGCTAAPSQLATGLQRATGIVVAGSMLYWANTNGSSIQSCALPSCAGGANTVATLAGSPGTMALSGTTLFLSATVNAQGRIYSCAASGCGSNPSVLVSGVSPSSLAVDGTRFYWNEEQAIVACPQAGCGTANPAMIVTDISSVYAFGLQAGVLYWADSQQILRQVL